MSEHRTGEMLTERTYKQLRRASETHREELAVRLCGEAGMRASEIATLRPGDVTENVEGGHRRTFVSLGGRTGFLSADLAHMFWQYVKSNGVAETERVIPVSERRIQMLISDVGARAATQTGRPLFEGITPSALRRYFARQLLVRHGVDVRVVAAVGGWEGVDGLLESLPAPSREEIAAAFEQLEADETDGMGRVAGVVETLAVVETEMMAANGREEVEAAVCQGLTEAYDAAWLISWERQYDRLTVREHAGESPDRFAGAARTTLVRRALETGRTLIAPDDPGPASDQSGRGQLAVVVIEHGETNYGALVVRSTERDAFADAERTVLSAFGRRVAFVLTAVERKQMLLGDSVLELRFGYEEGVVVGFATALSSPLELTGLTPTEGDALLLFVRVEDVAAERALEVANDQFSRSRLIKSDPSGAVLELVVTERSPVLSLTNRGGTVTEFTSADGVGHLTCEFPVETNVREIHDALREEFPSVQLERKREREQADRSLDAEDSLAELLTKKQYDVLRGAFYAGYFDWPRGSTAEDLASSMGISSPTLHNHLRKAQQQLLERLLADEYRAEI